MPAGSAGPGNPERMLALRYAPAHGRAALAALFALDDTLAAILRTTREPLVGQMRLTWWYEALVALDTAPPPAQPVLQALAAEVLPRGVTGATLARMIEGWEILLDPAPLDHAGLAEYAAGRGATLFDSAGIVLGGGAHDLLTEAGNAWALADLALHSRDAAVEIREAATSALAQVTRRRWGRRTRALGALALIARMDLAGGRPPGAPRRVARLAWHRLTGR